MAQNRYPGGIPVSELNGTLFASKRSNGQQTAKMTYGT